MPSDMRRHCMQDNKVYSCYLLTKISWKGSYKRLLAIGTRGITTYNKDTLRVTNQWTYTEIYSIRPDPTVKTNQPNLKRFILNVLDSNRRRHDLTFASEYRVEIITDLMKHRDLFIEKSKPNVRFTATKLGWSETNTSLILDIGPISIDQRDPQSGYLLKSYAYRDIESINEITDLQGGIAISTDGYSRIHVFITREPESFIQSVKESAYTNLNLTITQSNKPLTRDYCVEFRLGKASAEQFISQAEFSVQKLSNHRSSDGQKLCVSRVLCLTECLLVERDPISYRCISAHQLCEIHSIVRDRLQPQRFLIEYVRGSIITYYSTDRDALLASLLDGVRASGNRDVCIRSVISNRGLRFAPTIQSASEEIESVHLRFLRQCPEGVSIWEVLQRFNANVAYSGLLHAVTQDSVFAENKDKLIRDALTTILNQELPMSLDLNSPSHTGTAYNKIARERMNWELAMLEERFHALRRLVASKTGFNSFTQLPGMRATLGRLMIEALRRRDDAITHAVLDAINALMQPMHEHADIRQEQLNKASIMSSESFLSRLVDLFTLHALRGTGSLVLCALLDFFTFGICLPYSETSDGNAFDCLLRLISNRGRALFRLFHHPSLTIVRGAGMIMRSLIEEGGPTVAKQMRQLSLTEGALLHHFLISCFTNGKDPKSLATQQLSRQLIALWSDDNPDAWALFSRMLPSGLLDFLESDEVPPEKTINLLPERDNLQLAEEHIMRVEQRKHTLTYMLESKVDDLLTHWRLRVGLPAPKPNLLKEIEERPVVLRRPRHQTIGFRDNITDKFKMKVNWPYFFYQFQQDHSRPDLIWTISTRNELREQMEKELLEFKRERDYFAQSLLEENDNHHSSDLTEPIGVNSNPNKASSTPDTPSSTQSDTTIIEARHPNLNSGQPVTNAQDGDNSSINSKKSTVDEHDNNGHSNGATVMTSSTTTITTTAGRQQRETGKRTTSASPTRLHADRLITQASLVSWNYEEFQVHYASLISEPRVGNYYLRLLLEEDKRTNEVVDAAAIAHKSHTLNNNSQPTGLSRIRDSVAFFNELFRRYLQYVACGPIYPSHTSNIDGTTNLRLPSSHPTTALSSTLNPTNQNTAVHRLTMRCLCLHAMSVVYGRCYQEIGPISDIPLLIYLLDRTVSASERDCFLLLFDKLMLNKCNVNAFVASGGVRVLVDFSCLAHLHTTRPVTVFQSNVIKASSEQETNQSGSHTQREWWCLQPSTNEKSNKPQGPVTFFQLKQMVLSNEVKPNTLVYAQGLDAAPRCHPDGCLTEDICGSDMDDDDEGDAAANTTNKDNTNATREAFVDTHQQKSIIRGMYGWMMIKRVMQLRWAIPELMNSLRKKKHRKKFITENRSNSSHSLTSLIDSFGYNEGALFDYTTMATKCVDILCRLCDSCLSRDAHGGVVRPIPKPRQAITSNECLPHIVQLLLTFDPPLVERVIHLLHSVMDQNPYLPRLYLTGVFFFVLMYTGSNLLPIARFLKDVHLLQAFRKDEHSRLHGVDLASRSILGNLLPDAMIAYLENHPPEKFAEIFLGDFDSPEAIWNCEMRRFMIGRIASHLADFTPRLQSNARALYQFIEIPIIVYPQLEDELFCHNYYLRHLCDTKRFPDWPIRDPISLMRDILTAWRDELQKKPVNMSYRDALIELGLDPDKVKESNEEVLIRRAYYQMSMKYHPDKNTGDEGKFHKCSDAYQFLCNRSKLENGPNRLHIQLMLQAQVIVYKRYRSLLAAQKYPAYPLLLSTIQTETEDEKLFANLQLHDDESRVNSTTSKSNQFKQNACNAILLISATELVYQTILSSALNAEELCREHGIPILQATFSKCSVMLSSMTSRPDQAIVQICGHIVSVMTVGTQFSGCRQQIQDLPLLVKDVLRLLSYKNLPQLCCQSAACVATFCLDYWLCVHCYENGALYLLLQHVFLYDFTLEEADVEIAEETNSQVLSNRLALLCLWAIGRLVNGYSISREVTEDGQTTREGPEVIDALCRMLTPHLARKISELNVYDSSPIGRAGNSNDPVTFHEFPADTARGQYLRSVAKQLNTNSMTPYLIWDNRCRTELETLLDIQVARIVRTGECNLNAVTTFTHDSYAQELLIGEVFVRLYNKQPTYALDNPKGFAIDLLRYIATALENITPEFVPKADLMMESTTDTHTTLCNGEKHSGIDPSDFADIDWEVEAANASEISTTNLDLALEALTNVIHHNAGLELQCIGHFNLLFSLLELHNHSNLQMRVLEVIQIVSNNPECLADIAASNVLVNMVMLYPSLVRAHQLLLQTTDRLILSTILLKEFIYAGGLIYVLEIIACSKQQRVRQSGVHLISHCMADKQFGRRIRAIIIQYLPVILVDTIKDQPDVFLSLYDNDHENPELIWYSLLRDTFIQVIQEQTRVFYSKQMENVSVRWNLPDSFKVPYDDVIAKKANEDLSRRKDGAHMTTELEQCVACLGPVAVAGVYLHLYIASPGWALRHPELFLNELMEKLIEAMAQLPQSALLVRLLTRACTTVLTDRPGLLDTLPRCGHLYRVLDLLTRIDDPEGARSVVLLLHRMSASKLCVQGMCEKEMIGGLIRVVKKCIGEELGLVGETLFCIFDTPYSDPLVAQALEHDLIGFAMGILHNGLPPAVREPGQTRAYLVKALKSMQSSSLYGAKVTARLEAHPNWSEYRDQGHALFISNVPQSATAYLTAGPTTGSLYSGYLTTGPTVTENVPPQFDPYS